MFVVKSVKHAPEAPVILPLSKDTHIVPTADHARTVLWAGYPEEALIDWVRQNFISKDKVFVDIGAHVGVYTWLLAPYAKQVHAFEATPRTFCLLAANVALKGVEDTVRMHNVALGPLEGEATLHIRALEGGHNGLCRVAERDDTAAVRKVTVPQRKLDSYHLENVGFLKIDVEGFEKDVLMGATETLSRNGYPPFLFESWDDFRIGEGFLNVTQMRKELFEFIESLGYTVHPIRGFNEIFLATHPK